MGVTDSVESPGVAGVRGANMLLASGDCTGVDKRLPRTSIDPVDIGVYTPRSEWKVGSLELVCTGGGLCLLVGNCCICSTPGARTSRNS